MIVRRFKEPAKANHTFMPNFGSLFSDTVYMVKR